MLHYGGYFEAHNTYMCFHSLLESGRLQVVNHHLLKDLTELGLWDETMKHKLIAYGGSVQVRQSCG